MESRLKQPYEISLWEDRLIEDGEKSYYKEVKIATIGSDTMTAPSRIHGPVLTTNVNGEITLSFKIVHRYYDDQEEKYVINPFERFLVNERKVKLFFDNEWYDFVIKECEEDSDSNVFDYKATGLFINELSKVGYNIVLSNELSNNQGTIFELGEKAVKGTDWIIDKDSSDIIQQYVAEPLYIYKPDQTIELIDILTNKSTFIEPSEDSSNEILIFYSVISNSQTENVHVLCRKDFADSVLDDNNVAYMPNYKFTVDKISHENGTIKVGDVTLTKQVSDSNPTGINLNYQGYRLAYNQRTAYDTIKERPVLIYKAKYDNGTEETIYKYTDYEYATSDVVTSYITNGSGFNIYNTGSIEGWSNATPVNKSIVSKPFSSISLGTILGDSLHFINVKDMFTNGHIVFTTVDEEDNPVSKNYNLKVSTLSGNFKGTISFIYHWDARGVSNDTLSVKINNNAATNFTPNSSDTFISLLPLGSSDVTVTEIIADENLGYISDFVLLFESHLFHVVNQAAKGSYVLQPLELVTYPSVSTKSIQELAQMTGIKGYLRTKFQGIGGPSVGYVNTIFNSGVGDSRELIGSFSKGENYVFRISYGTTTEDGGEPLNPEECNIRAVVAKYTQQEITVWNQEDNTEEKIYINTIDPNSILFDFNTNFVKKNNIISGGHFQQDGNGVYFAYYKDGVSVAPSVDYCYVETTEEGEEITKVWSATQSAYVDKDNTFLDYWYATAPCTSAISNSDLSSYGGDYGIFLYSNSDKLKDVYTCIKEVQLFKEKKDKDEDIILVGNIPKSTAISTDFYYIKPSDDITDESQIETFSDIDALAEYLLVSPDDIQPYYNENFEKISSIEANQSNCFNIIQDLCEAFECWSKFTVKHDKNGAISLDSEGVPVKKISFHKYSGDDNFAGFKYGINLNSIQRTIDSEEFVSKLIVEQVENDTVDGGVVSIAGAPSNPSGESYILNMSYYLNQGLIENPAEWYRDYNSFIEQLKNINSQYTLDKTQWELAAIARTKAKSNLNVYTELISEAKKDLTDQISEFENLTGIKYGSYVEGNGYSIVFSKTGTKTLKMICSKVLESIVPSFFDANGSEILVEESNVLNNVDTVAKTYIISDDNNTNYNTNQIVYAAIVNTLDGFEIKDSWASYSTWAEKAKKSFSVPPAIVSQFTKYIWQFNQTTININVLSSNDNETLTTLVGKIYTDQQVEKEYSSLLELARQEKSDLDLLIDGTKNYTITVSTFSKVVDGVQVDVTKEYVNDYIEGLSFTLISSSGTWDVETSITEKSFEQNQLYNTILFRKYPENYQLQYTIDKQTFTTNKPIRLEVATDSTKSFTLIPIEKQPGLKDKMQDLLDQKEEVEKAFYKKYSRFIQEGTWTSSDYVDNELYYLDALNVSNTSAQPKLTYTLQVAEISEQEGLQNYKFKVGDKTYIEDPQFFGYRTITHEIHESFDVVDGIIDLPINTTDVIDVTRGYEDNYAKVDYVYSFIENKIYVSSTVSEGEQLRVYYSYKIETPIREEVIVSEVEWHLDELSENSITIQNYKTQFEDLFQRISATVQSVEYNSGSYARAASVLDEGGFINAGLLLKSLNQLAGGFALSGDNAITAAEDGIVIKDLMDPLSQMKLAGNGLKTSTDGGYTWNTVLNANNGLVIDTIDTQEVIIKDGDNPSFRWDKYGLNAYGFKDVTDLKTYVRFDKYGLYGVLNAEEFQAQSLQDVKDTAQFGLLWNGFFIKNSYNDGYVSISSDEDFQVVAGDTERIKIGALEKKADGTYEYGIRIKNSEGQPVFITDDQGDIAITGEINATGGNFTNSITVGSGNDTIVLQGLEDDAVIGSSDYFTDGSKGWAIKSDGDAVFNNITARGAIKTAVFEYEEIEAVGGIFIFRPSSTIRTAEVKIAESVPGMIPANPPSVLDKFYYTYNEEEAQYILTDEPTYEMVAAGEVNYYRYDETNDTYILLTEQNYETETAYEMELDPKVTYYEYNETTGSYTVVENPTVENVESYYVISDVPEDETEVPSKDLLLTVENPLLFSAGDWCKVSNYSPENADASIEHIGLTNIYEIASIDNSVITLRNGAEMFDNVFNPPSDPEPFETTSTSNNNIYRIQGFDGNLTPKYNYSIIITEENESVSDNESDSFIDDNLGVLCSGVPETVIFSDPDNYSVYYIGNLYLWNNNAEYNTEETYLFISVNNEVYLYFAEGSEFYDNTGSVKTLGINISQHFNPSYEVNSLVGGALISFANYPTSSEVSTLTQNYGIGINSSDSAMNLPARAISLFETEIQPNDSVKVNYNFRGILGTLPALPATSVNTDIYDNMIGTQGIYTDNMYLGDLQQYLAFYTDKDTGEKKLKISAAEISFEIPDEHGQGSGHYQNVADIEAEGVPGPPGEDAVIVKIDSTAGNFFRMGNVSTSLIAHVYKGTTDITSQVSSFDWYRRLPNGDRDTTWVSPSTSNLLPLTPSDVDEKAVFVCEVMF